VFVVRREAKTTLGVLKPGKKRFYERLRDREKEREKESERVREGERVDPR